MNSATFEIVYVTYLACLNERFIFEPFRTFLSLAFMDGTYLRVRTMSAFLRYFIARAGVVALTVALILNIINENI